jgi:transcriptional regulator with XRE-family HTH domain
LVDVAGREIPKQWLKLLGKHGIGSARKLAEKMDVGPSTATRLLQGEPVDEDTIDKAAAVLKTTAAQIRELRGEPPRKPFHLPEIADLLTPRQRQAVLAVVRAMVEPATDEAGIHVRTIDEADAQEQTSLAELSPPRSIVEPVAKTPRRRPK